jgi:hypothetical protein
MTPRPLGKGASGEPGPDYGTFAEIGAGQEVARWFFRVGGAAGTVAKTISAYDMAVSDALYGSGERYVSRQRLEAMLEREFAELIQSLGGKRGDTNTFFAFANTVATRSHKKNGVWGIICHLTKTVSDHRARSPDIRPPDERGARDPQSTSSPGRSTGRRPVGSDRLADG